MRRVAIAAPHGVAVDAAADAVGAGGNALDATLAAAAALVVVYPHQCSLGGDLTALVRHPDGRVETVLSVGAAAAAIDVSAIRATGAGMPRQGPLSVTVPGVVAGWMRLAAAGAELGLRRPLSAAAELSERGAPVSPGLERAIVGRLDAVQSDPGLSQVLLRGGSPVTGSFAQPALSRSLAELAEDPESFYTGALADRLSAGLAKLGSPITASDLAAHHVESPAPLELETAGPTGGMRWWAAPPPAQGATALALLDPDNEGDLLTRARAAHAARAEHLGDPRGGRIDVDALLHPVPLDAGAAVAPTRAAGDTVAVTAVDSDGRCVALIQSVFQTFGSGLLEPDTGIVLHNRGAAFVVLDDPDAHAAHPGQLAGGRRPPHTLCPLLAEGRGVRVALGCQGGRAQPLILAQVAADATDPQLGLDATLSRPRWVVGDRDIDFEVETVLAEPDADLPPLAGLPVAAAPGGGDDRCGHVQVARMVEQVEQRDGLSPLTLEAAADPRADGRATVTVNPQQKRLP